MSEQPKKKLELHKEKAEELTDDELDGVAGGVLPSPPPARVPPPGGSFSTPPAGVERLERLRRGDRTRR